jgi:CheY-like chemotaxis protein
MAETTLAGRRVFVVEDEWLIQVLIEDALGELGCSVSDSAARLDEALAKAATVTCDVAVLDINLNAQSTYAVAAVLQARSVPLSSRPATTPRGSARTIRTCPWCTSRSGRGSWPRRWRRR